MLKTISRRTFTKAIVLSLTTVAAQAQTAIATAVSDTAIWSELQKGGYVLLIRHAEAPGTFDPPGFKLGVCSSQRNLSDEGRAQAKRLGELLRAKNVPIDQVYSSPWCRCQDTATLAFGADKVQTWVALGSPRGGDEKQRQAYLVAVKQRIQSTAIAASMKANMVFVTHMFNIQDITGEGLAQGEIVVLKRGDKSMRVVARIPT